MGTYEKDFFIHTDRNVWNYSLFTEEEVRNFQAGTNYHIYQLFGNHALHVRGTDGVYFAVWAPYATMVSVIGSFNEWHAESHQLIFRKAVRASGKGLFHTWKKEHYTNTLSSILKTNNWKKRSACQLLGAAT